MTVASRKPPAPAKYQKKGALVGITIGCGDEDYVETGEDQGNDDAEFDIATAVEITTPKKAAKKKIPAKAPGKAKAKVSRQDDVIYDGGALDSEYDASDTGTAKWYEDTDSFGADVDDEIPSESDTETITPLHGDVPPSTHQLKMDDERVKVNGIRKRRQRQYKPRHDHGIQLRAPPKKVTGGQGSGEEEGDGGDEEKAAGLGNEGSDGGENSNSDQNETTETGGDDAVEREHQD
ncbi:hypothetical protein PInf_010166 [Phytophthora infestans]|nr:hypothetical protein PInf_010166 [Phytophthora infestans]